MGRWVWIGWAVFASFVAKPAAAQDAQDAREIARAEFARGVEAYGAGEYRTALNAFQEAYRLRPHPSVRVNMANCYDHLDRPLEALVHFEAYLRETGRDAPRDQRREVEQAIERLRDRVGEVVLHIAPDGAIARINDGDERRAPIADAIRLVAGTHRVEVRLEGFRTESREIIVAGGQRVEMNISLEHDDRAPQVGAQVEDGASVEEPARRSDVRGEGAGVSSASSESRASASRSAPPSNPGMQITAPVAVIGTVTAVSGVAAIIAGTLAIVANGDFNRQVQRANDTSLALPQRISAQNNARDAANTARNSALAGDILGATAVVGLVTTAVLFFSQAGVESAPPAQPAIVLAPVFGQDVAGVSLQGTF